MTLGEWIGATERRFASAGIDTPKLDAQLIAAELLTQTRSWVLAHPEHTVQGAFAESHVGRRLQREPLAYILGKREFYGREFVCDQRALVPRNETEILVERALLSAQGREGLRVLDLCTGTGCVGLTLKAERGDLEVTLSDISQDAADLASQNAKALGLTCEVLVADLFDGLGGRRFDLGVSNPPYVGTGDPLPPEIQGFEPHLALYAGPSGLDIYRRIASGAATVGSKELVLEIGLGQQEEVESVFGEHGWQLTDVTADLAGIPRVVAFSAGNPDTGQPSL